MSSIKRKRVSKKSKESWRRHVNIQEIENYLERQISDKKIGFPDQDLFKIDNSPSNTSSLSRKERRILLKYTTPKCFGLLKPDVEIPEVKTKSKRLTPKRRKQLRTTELEREKLLRRIRKKEMEDRETKIEKELENNEVKSDIWATDTNNENLLNNEWFDKTIVRHNIIGLGKMQKKVPRSYGKKTSFTPNVEIPHPGMSYNPSYKDHQNLLNQVAEKEMKLIKQQKHLDRVTTQMFSKVTPQKREQNWIVEMSQGLKPSKPSEDQEESDGEYKAVNPPVKNKKKDERKRRKQKLHLQLEEERRQAKIEKKKLSDIYKLRKFNEEMEKTNELLKIQKAKREKAKQKKKLETKRLGASKFEEPDLEFNAPQELSGNLRNIKMEGHLLKERFNSFQKRNIIQPSLKRLKKRAKVKIVVRASHKDVTETQK